jgi:hypothetical protein
MNLRIKKKHDWDMMIRHIHEHADDSTAEQVRWLSALIGNLTNEITELDERIEVLEDQLKAMS